MKNKNKDQKDPTEKQDCTCQDTQDKCQTPECDKDQCKCEESQVDLEQELAKQKDAFLRLYAEFDNYKKRSQRERVEWIKTASQDVLESILPIVDDFERGLQEAQKQSKEELVMGFELIYNKLLTALKQKGLVAIPVKKGDEFDVDLHESIARIPVEEAELKDKIVDVTQKGYKLADKVLRYAKVVVGA